MAAFDDDDAPVPPEIACADQIFDLSFHPGGEYLACGLIDGAVELWKYGLDANEKVFSSNPHQGSCRGLQFNSDGSVLYSISSDGCLRGIDGVGKETFKIENAHPSSINKMSILDTNLLSTGDDNGIVNIWDVRQSGQTPIMSWNVHTDFISGFAYNNDRNTLLSTSGDATLTAYDMKKGSSINNKGELSGYERSDDQEAELNCCVIIKNGKKIVCGTHEGVLLVFTWGHWGDCSDRYPGHPETVDCLYKIDENTVMTGSSDGIIRAVSIQPNKMIGVLGDHEEFPVEGMYSSIDGKFLASYAHDNLVRFNDISMFVDDEDDVIHDESSASAMKTSADGEDEDEDEDGEFGSDDDEDDDNDKMEQVDDDSSDFDSASSDDEMGGNGRAAGAGSGGYKMKSAAEKFYSDL